MKIMRNKILAILTSVTLMLAMVVPANSKVLWKQEFGKFEIFAWSGQYQYCSIKTYWDSGEEFSLRYSTVDGLYLAATMRRPVSPQSITVYFNENKYGTFRSQRGPSDRQLLIFIPDKYADDFFEAFKASYTMNLRGSNIHLGVDLEGTRLLGENLVSCVDRFGF
jgi:hypothetical protein